MDTQHSLRDMLGLAREVRLDLRDSRVIFASVVSVHDIVEECFVVRPWGLRSAIAIRFDEVCRARPVRRMVWQHQRTICAAQVAALTGGKAGLTREQCLT
jgi:hypothetical protein